MCKEIKRFLSFVLALALILTTFSSDLASTKVYAVGSVEEMNETTDNTEDGNIFESFSGIDEKSDAVDNANEGVVTEPSDESGVEATNIIASEENTSNEESTEVSTEETSVDASVDASSEASSEDASAVASTEASEDAATLASSVEELEFDQDKVIDGIKISLYAKKGVLPADAELRVEKVETSLEEKIEDAIDAETGSNVNVEKTYSYDINIYSESEGKNVQPEDGTVRVTFEQVHEASDKNLSLEVYHVKENDGEVQNVEKVATGSKNSTETEISFDAEHFSIYTLTLVEDHWVKGDYTNTITVSLVNENGESIGKDVSNKIKLDPLDWFEISASQVAPTISCYDFSMAKLGDEEFDYFSLDKGKVYAYVEKIGFDKKIGEIKSDSKVTFVYKEAVYKTYDHLDLGFTDEEFKLYKNDPSTKIYAYVNGHKYSMGITGPYNGYDAELGTYEYRLDLGVNGAPESVKSTDTIVFEVEYKGQTYRYSPTSLENAKAYESCYYAHRYIQNVFGFDYYYNFTDQFVVVGNLIYNKNDGSTTKPVADKQEGEHATSFTFTVKDIKDTGLGTFEGHTFLGWSESADAKVPQYKAGDSIVVEKNGRKELYAVWGEEDIYVPVYATDGSGKAVVNPQFKSILGLEYVQWDSYYPVGVIKLPASFFEGKTSPYITSEEDLNAVLDAVKAIDKSCLKDGGVGNANNTVAENLKYVQRDIGKDSNSKFTALFDYTYSPSINHPEGGSFKYHLDLRFTTNDVTYKGLYFTGDKKTETKDLGEVATYLSGAPLTYKDASDVVSAYANGYKLEDIYTDEACTQKFNGLEAISANMTLYAKFTKSERESLAFFIIKDSYAGVPNAGPQESKYYYPESGKYDWKGSAKNFDLLTPTYTGSNGYVSIYNWENGINQEYTGWAYDTGVKDKINAYVSSTFGSNFSESDVVWYVYKRQSGGSRHIDGYVAANVTYNANNGGTTADGKTEVAGNKVRFGTTTDVLANMFTNSNSNFVGWNTKADGTGTWYGTTYNNKTIKVNDKIVLYAQWDTEVTFKANFIVQGEDGSFYTDGTPNYIMQKEFTIKLKDGETKSVTPEVYKNTMPSKISSYLIPAIGGVKMMFDRNIVDEQGVTYTVAPEEVAGNWSGTVSEDGEQLVLNIYYLRDDFSTDVVVTSLDEEWFYDGTAHEYDKEEEFTYTSSSKNIEVTDVTLASNKVTNVSDNKPGNNEITALKIKNTETGKEYSLTVKDGKVVTGGDAATKVTVVNGSLKIKPRTVTLTSKTLTKEFDLKALTANERVEAGETDAKDITATAFNAETGEGFVAGEGIDASKTEFTGSRVEVGGTGEGENEFTYVLASGLLKETKAENYTIATEFGDLVVTDREEKFVIKVRLGAEGNGGDTVLPYNGSSQHADLTVHVYVDAESSSGLEDLVNRLNSLLSNVTSIGTLVVHAEESEPETPEGTKVDAEKVKINGVEVTVDNLYVSGGEGTDVGKYPVVLNSDNMTVDAVIDGKEIDLSKQVRIEVENNITTVTNENEAEEKPESSEVVIGNLVVEKRNVTLTSASARKQQDGNPLTNSTVTVSGDGFANGEAGQEGAIYNVTGSITNEGSTPNAFTYTLQENTKADNYNITTVFGTLEIYTVGGEDNPPAEGGTVTTATPAAAPAGAVLGARRDPAANGQAVLGARRARTEDATNNTGRFIVILIAAGLASCMTFIGRKKKEEKE